MQFLIQILYIHFKKKHLDYCLADRIGILIRYHKSHSKFSYRMDDKYNKEEVDKFCNYNSFIKLNNETKYY